MYIPHFGLMKTICLISVREHDYKTIYVIVSLFMISSSFSDPGLASAVKISLFVNKHKSLKPEYQQMATWPWNTNFENSRNTLFRFCYMALEDLTDNFFEEEKRNMYFEALYLILKSPLPYLYHEHENLIIEAVRAFKGENLHKVNHLRTALRFMPEHLPNKTFPTKKDSLKIIEWLLYVGPWKSMAQ